MCVCVVVEFFPSLCAILFLSLRLTRILANFFLFFVLFSRRCLHVSLSLFYTASNHMISFESQFIAHILIRQYKWVASEQNFHTKIRFWLMAGLMVSNIFSPTCNSRPFSFCFFPISFIIWWEFVVQHPFSYRLPIKLSKKKYQKRLRNGADRKRNFYIQIVVIVNRKCNTTDL